jgi:hypothetical protein
MPFAVPSLEVKTTPFLLLALLAGAAAVMLYRGPVQRYAVACERTTQVTCDLEQATAARTQRRQVPLGPNPSAVVRIVPRRRAGPRVLLYLRSAANEVFAAEFEGANAGIRGEAAAAQLNSVLEATAPASVRITVAAPPFLRWLAWSALGVMALLVLAGLRGVLTGGSRASRA